MKKILEQNKLGLLEIGKDRFSDDIIAYISIPARYISIPNELKKKGFKSIRSFIKSYHETQIGGVKGGEGTTDYSIMIENIKSFLRYHKHRKWATIEEILNYCETHYANPKPGMKLYLHEDYKSLRKGDIVTIHEMSGFDKESNQFEYPLGLGELFFITTEGIKII
ncbi:hypothetical protein ACPCZR_25390 [Bacillus bombysepticus]